MKYHHTFVICAYGQSPYLGACIRSLKNQSVPSRIVLCTSTPSFFLNRIAARYQIPVFVRQGVSGIGEDWNFAYESADSEWVTIAHQDDIYRRHYLKTFLDMERKYPDMSLYMTDSITIRNGKPSKKTSVEWVKKLLRLPLRLPLLNHITWVKRSVLIWGNPVICPSCTYRRGAIQGRLFSSSFHFALDWETLWKLASAPGRWICWEHPGIYYRVHQNATTHACIRDHTREKEEQAMYERIWPKPVAGVLMHFYRKAYHSYE